MKKVLIITYYWPPSGGGGVQRWLKFAKYLPEFGWEPVIFTPENPDFDIQDQSLLKDVSSELEVIKLPIWEPYTLFAKVNKGKKLKQGLVSSDSKQSWLTSLALFIRGNFFIPDPRKFWVKPSIKFLSRIIDDNKIDVVVTSGPPHSMHLIGLGLKKKLGIKWLADFRDPWSKWDMLDQFKMTSLVRGIHRRLERKVLANADEVLTVSQSWSKEFEQIHQRKYSVINNGFDADDFETSISKSSDKQFVISHFGLINQFRNPVNFWKAIKKVIHDNPQLSFKINLFGTIEASILDALKNDKLLKAIVEIKSPVSHDQVLKEYQKSDVLLLLLNNTDNAKGHIPGKLFEYMASGRYVLALGPADGDSASIINETGIGKVLDWHDAQGIEEALKATLQATDSNRNSNAIGKYTRKALTENLAQLLNRI
ncbi:glycosyltransferase family 4 protein [Fulvivirga lutimaris]|uniref:glycosyltransferase family 4 protein n=1 Tax=Fulvivirga lutimaris TaxID=1819566 RepID=UPI0012BBA6F1|nr:glycosyltransferase family 4 protein [Fulvivirga lutimaris]MTI40908.1 glycosyl transferase family 1 [Fulvivirga lutimaris]